MTTVPIWNKQMDAITEYWDGDSTELCADCPFYHAWDENHGFGYREPMAACNALEQLARDLGGASCLDNDYREQAGLEPINLQEER